MIFLSYQDFKNYFPNVNLLLTKTVSFYFVLTTYWQNAFPFLFFTFYTVKIATMSDMHFIQLNMESNIRKLKVNKSKLYKGILRALTSQHRRQ